MKKDFDILHLANENACFDLQFRKDTRHDRTNAPTYYRWKVQFILTLGKESKKIMEHIGKELQCGKVTVSANQSRLSVQNIDDIKNLIIPFFTKKTLMGNKKKEFQLWQKAVEIVARNKGTYLSEWKRSDLLSLMQIHTSTAKYKNNPREPKWITMAKTLTKSA